MTMYPDNKADVEGLKTVLQLIAEFDPEELAVREGLGKINFAAGRPLFERAISLAKEMASLRLDLLPSESLGALNSAFSQVLNSFRNIASFSIEQDRPVNVRDSLLTATQNSFLAAIRAEIQFGPYLNYKSGLTEETVRASRELLEMSEKLLDEGKEQLESSQNEVESIVSAVRDSAAKAGVAHHAKVFEELAEAHSKASVKWLVAAGVLGAVTAGLAIISVYVMSVNGQLSEGATVQRIVAKVLVVSMAYFATLWAAKNYRAHKHLEELNTHRQAALKTFETFIAGSSDEQTKNAVLLESTRCVFAPGSTGYLEKQEQPPSSRVLEIFKSVASGKGSE